MPHHHHHHHHHRRHHHSDNNLHTTRVSGHKRERDFQDSDGTGHVKLFVGSVPRTITEDQVRPMFEEYGDVLEVAIIKDKRTGLQQGCCFVKYSSRDEADRAIRCLNNQRTLPGGSSSVQVRYADGERERLGAVEHKLFVGCLNKQANEKEIEEIFSPHGRVDDVYIMRDEHKESRGCAFIKYPARDMAMQAIAALNNVYIMRGCDQPLAVRFADPKRPKTGGSDSRSVPRSPSRGSFSPRHGGSGSSSSRSSNSSQHQQSSRDSPPPITWRQANALSIRGLTQGGGPPYPLARLSPSHAASPASMHGQMNGIPPQSPYIPAASPQHDMFQPPPQRPGPVPQYVHLTQAPPPLPYQLQQQIHQLQPPQQQPSFQQLQQQLPSLIPPQHFHPSPPLHLQNGPPPQQQQQQQQQQQVLQACSVSQPASWLPAQLVQSLLGPPALPVAATWTEHTSPDGYKYYYNSVTRESKWEKPDELLKGQALPPPPPPPDLTFAAGGNAVDQLRQQVWI